MTKKPKYTTLAVVLTLLVLSPPIYAHTHTRARAHQDTCVALQALSEYAILSYVGGVNLTISLASTNLDFQETFELHRDNKKILQSAKVRC